LISCNLSLLSNATTPMGKVSINVSLATGTRFSKRPFSKAHTKKLALTAVLMVVNSKPCMGESLTKYKILATQGNKPASRIYKDCWR